MRKLCIFFIFLIQSSICFASIKNVIYVTLDGTRWQDVFLDHSHFEKFWNQHAKQVKIYGEPLSDNKVEVASVPISLPSYQSQMSGQVQSRCHENDCGRIQAETLPETLLTKLHLKSEQIAIFASWYPIALSTERVEGEVMNNTGNQPMIDPMTHQADVVMEKINKQQALDHPQSTERYDKYTFAQAMHYFKKYHPTFLWISLNDADEAAHEGNIKAYHDALHYYDDAMNELLITLNKQHLDKNTLVIITTDHGRGNGENWKDHGIKYPESKQTWAFVMNGDLVPVSQQGNKLQYSTLSIRPTIEKALGVTP